MDPVSSVTVQSAAAAPVCSSKGACVDSASENYRWMPHQAERVRTGRFHPINKGCRCRRSRLNDTYLVPLGALHRFTTIRAKTFKADLGMDIVNRTYQATKHQLVLESNNVIQTCRL